MYLAILLALLIIHAAKDVNGGGDEFSHLDTHKASTIDYKSSRFTAINDDHGGLITMQSEQERCQSFIY